MPSVDRSGSKTAAGRRLPLERARRHWHRIQGLAQPARGPAAHRPEQMIAGTGWLRTLGGVDAYLAARARISGMRRADLDAAALEGRLQVTPAVRGCIYLVPQPDVPLVLRIAQDQHQRRAERELERAGVARGEIQEIAGAVLELLRQGPRTTDALRKALPPGLVRSLGERGRKVGLSSPLPFAIRQLEFAGQVVRTPEGGRLDSERYLWGIPAVNPFAGARVPETAAGRHAALAGIFLRHAGPVSAADFAAWAGLSQREALAALRQNDVETVAVAGYAEQAFMASSEVAGLEEEGPAENVSLLSFEDNYQVLHGGPAVVTAPAHLDRPVEVWGHTRGTTLRDAKHISMRSIFDGDRLVGFWEMDPQAGRVVWASFEPLPAGRRRLVEEAAEQMSLFLRDEMGHAKSYSLDTVEAIGQRAAIVKAM